MSERVIVRGHMRNKFLQIIYQVPNGLLQDIYRRIAKLVDKETHIQNHFVDFQKIKIYLAERHNINLREYFEDIITEFSSVDVIEQCLKCNYLLYFINVTLVSARYLNLKHN